MRKTTFLLVALIFVSLGVLVADGTNTLQGQQTPPTALFADAAAPVVMPDESRQPTVMRSRFVTVDFGLLPDRGALDVPPARGARLLLNLFDDVSLVAVIDRLDPNATGVTWVGHVEGVALSTVTLVAEAGLMAGSIVMPQGVYAIRSAGEGVHAIYQIDQSAYPPEAPPIPIRAPEGEAPAGPQGDARAPAVAPQGDTAGTIDVMVVYTPAARSAAGGTSAMNTLVNLGISETNTSYANSGIAQRLRLAHSQEVTYTEVDPNMSQDLTNLQAGLGGLSGVPGLRDTYRADLVTLLTHYASSPYCGLGYFMQTVNASFEANGFNIVAWNCVSPNYSFAHELGHNMGAMHDWYIDNGVQPYTYAHGYAYPPGGWRTIMAYNNLCAALGPNCTRLLYWANPSVSQGGVPMGIAGGTKSNCPTGSNTNYSCDADDHLALNNTALTVANFRQALATCTYTVSPTSDTAPAGGASKSASVTTTAGCAWTAVSNNPTFLTVTGGASGTGSGTVSYTVAANSTTSQRIGTLTIAGQTLTVTQAAAVGGVPTITITSPTSASTHTATSPWLYIAGTASSNTVGVTWTNSAGGSGTATGTTSWNAMVPLQKGSNVITVRAADAGGDTATPAEIRASGTDTLTVTVSVFRYSLAEGSTGSFFQTDLLIGNPNNVAASVTTTFLKEDGTTVVDNRTLAAYSRTTLTVNSLAGLDSTAFSAVVQSNDGLPLLVERTMFWQRGGWYGGHTGSAVDEPQTKWYFGEGSQGFFDTYVLLANSNATTATVTVSFLREGDTPVVGTYTVNPTSRVNVYAGAISNLINRSFSIVVDSNIPIIAERAMYFGGPSFWEGGHESAGVPRASTSWFHAEGATGSFFDTYVLIGNPNFATANVTLTYLLDSGVSIVRNKTVPANSRLTVNIEGESDSRLASAAVATTVTSDIPVISERAMYWPGAYTSWYEAHNSFGLTEIGTKWGLAEGSVGWLEQFETYILLANPSTTATAAVTVTYMRKNGTTVTKTYSVGPTKRYNIHVNSMVPELSSEDFSALITVTNGVPIAVERAMYWSTDKMWTGGTNATAIRLP